MKLIIFFIFVHIEIKKFKIKEKFFILIMRIPRIIRKLNKFIDPNKLYL